MSLEKTRHYSGLTVTYVAYIGAVVLLCLVLLTTANVTMRYVFIKALRGYYELAELSMIVIVFFGVAYTLRKNSHVTVDLLIDRWPTKVQAIIRSVVYLIVIAFLGILVGASITEGIKYMSLGSASNLLHIPDFPFKFVVAFGSFLFLIEAIFKFRDYMTSVIKNS